MKPLLRIFLVSASGLMFASCTTLPEKPQPSCQIVTYGLVSSEGALGDSDNSNSITGKNSAFSGINIYKQTNLVPIRPQLRFGVEHVFLNIPGNQKIRHEIHHPRMIAPSGKEFTVQVFDKDPTDSGTSYGFDELYEYVEGKWRFEFWYGTKLLCAQEFTSYREK